MKMITTMSWKTFVDFYPMRKIIFLSFLSPEGNQKLEKHWLLDRHSLCFSGCPLFPTTKPLCKLMAWHYFREQDSELGSSETKGKNQTLLV